MIINKFSEYKTLKEQNSNGFMGFCNGMNEVVFFGQCALKAEQAVINASKNYEDIMEDVRYEWHKEDGIRYLSVINMETSGFLLTFGKYGLTIIPNDIPFI